MFATLFLIEYESMEMMEPLARMMEGREEMEGDFSLSIYTLKTAPNEKV